MKQTASKSEADKRLFAAINTLENAIKTAKSKVSSNLTHQDTVARLMCYESMVHKQRILVNEMISHRDRGNWDEFKRHADLLAGTSNMIQLDVVSILSEISGRNTHTA